MKKQLLTLAGAVCTALAVNAQTVVYSEDFNDQDVNNWGVTIIDEDGLDAASNYQGIWPPPGTPFIYYNDNDIVVTGTALATSNFLNTGSTANDWIITDPITLSNGSGLYAFVFDQYGLSENESFEVYVNTGDATSANMLAGTKILDVAKAETGGLTETIATIDAALSGQTVRLGIRHTSAGGNVLFFDNFEVIELPNVDLQLTNVGFVNGIVGKESCPSGTVYNFGSSAINSFDVITKVDNQIVSTTTVSNVDIAPNESYDFNTSESFDFANFGSIHTIEISVSNPNGGIDDDLSNNAVTTEDLTVGSGALVNRQVLIEEYSTAPCQFCPDGARVLDEMKSFIDGMIVAQIHAGFGTDAMTIPEHQTIAGQFTNGAPTANIDRVLFDGEAGVGVSRGIWAARTLDRLAIPSQMCVSLEQSYNSSTRTLDLTVNAEVLELMPSDDYRISIHLIQDEVVGTGAGYDQQNADNNTPGHPYQGAGNPIVGYVHRDVVVDMATDVWGATGIIPNSPELNQTYSYNTSVSIDPAWDENLMRIVAFVHSYNGTAQDGHEVINAVSEHLDQAVAYSCEVTAAECAKINSVNTINQGAKSIAYPNPIQNDDLYVRFDMKSGSKLNAKFIAADGQIVAKATGLLGRPGANEFKLNTTSLGSGLYNVVFTNEAGEIVVSHSISVVK